MKCIILQEHLIKLLSRVGRIVSPKTQLPILGTVLLQATDGELKAATTTTELSMASSANAKVEKEGGLCVPEKLLAEFVATLPDDKVTLEEKDGSLSISCGGYNATIPGVSKSEFPPIATRSKSAIKIDKKDVIKAIKQVLFSAATDEGRPILTGIKIKKQEDGVVIVATDGYRLSVKQVSMKNADLGNVVIPAKALSEMVRVSEEEKDGSDTAISFVEDGQVGLFVGDTEIYTRVIDGEYPNYEKIIPKTKTTTAVLDAEVFLKAVKSAAVFARESANIIKLHIEEGVLTASANTPQVGENTVTIDAKTEGDTGDIAFNSRFLLEFLGTIIEEKIIFEMTGSLNPGVFKLEKDDSYLHIIMPVRVQN